jgi:hypothetical protein
MGELAACGLAGLRRDDFWPANPQAEDVKLTNTQQRVTIELQ